MQGVVRRQTVKWIWRGTKDVEEIRQALALLDPCPTQGVLVKEDAIK